MDRAPFKEWKSAEVARLLALVESERRYYQEIIAAIPVGLVVVSADLTFVSANRYFRQTFGLRGDEIPQKRVEGLLAIGGLADKVRVVLSAGTPELDIRLDVGDKSYRIAILPFRSWDDWNQEALLVFETSGEARKARQPDLQDFDAVLWERDATTLAITFVGGRVAPLLGFPAESWLSDPGLWLERVCTEDRDRVLAFYRVGRDGDCEYRMTKADGSAVWVRDTVRVRDGKLYVVTTDITERRSLETRESLAATMDALRKLAGRVAHDCNNLLMIITGYGEELVEALSSQPSRREDLDEILKAARRLGDITKQLQSDTRRPTLTREEVVQAFGGQVADTSDVELTEEGAFLRPGRYTVLTIRGVRTGLDISIAPLHAAVRGMGGDLAITAGEIQVYLPSGSGPVPVAPQPVARPQPALETILVVEDEPGIRALMRKILQRHGYTVLEAGNADDALRQAREYKGPVHLVITDVVLPQTTGKKIAEQVTALRPQTKVLYVSGFTDDVTIEPAMLLLKPFTLGSLLEKVRQILG